jgi:hypothetical protein
VVGILLMPSATRAPLHVATAAQGSAPATSSGTTTPRAATTTTLPAVVPGASTIHVLVANGTTVTALASGVGHYLQTRGYAILGAVNATTKVSATHVYAAAGEQGAAGTVVSVLGLPSSDIQPPSAVAPVASAARATVVVVAGPELSRFAPSGSSSPGSTPG